MAIVCLGWGSLIWRPEELPCDPRWRDDGPDLPIEFARVSSGGRVTLVIVDGAPQSRVLWSPLRAGNLEEAVKMLAAREKTLDLNQIGRWPAPKNSAFPFSDVIEAWAKAKEFEGVVWAALEPGFPKQRGQVPTLDQLLENLEHLKGQNLADAIEYVEKTPVQIKTAHRPALEKALALPSENPAPVAVSFQGNVELPNDNLSNDNIPPDPPDVFLTRLVEKLSGQDGIDRELASILASSILKAAPSKDAVEDAFSKIKKLAETRAAPVQEALDG